LSQIYFKFNLQNNVGFLLFRLLSPYKMAKNNN